jgi:membrane-bound serine protease (ClpP class)
VIPVSGMIERGLLYVLRRGLTQAEREGAGVVILHMDTPGGKVNVTEDIIRLLVALPSSVRTITFVDPDALSAGALIAMSTDEIYMAPGSRIGASAIVTAFGDIKDGDMKEKFVSSLVALASSAAERKGHDPALVEAMIRREAEYRIGDEVLCPAGELLTLTDLDAVRIVGEGDEARPLLAAGTVKTLDELIRAIGREGLPVHTIQVTWSERIARWVELFGFLFLLGGILGLYIEFKIPGFGLPGVAGILCLAVFFWGHHVAGLAGMEELLLFILGAALLAVEIFVIPGFGVTGIAGIALMFGALLMAMVQFDPLGGWMPTSAGQFQTALITLTGSILGAFVAGVLLARYLPGTQAFSHIALGASVGSDAGYRASDPTDSLIGLRGVAATDLHPGGIGDFGDRRLDVVSQGVFIAKGAPIAIVEGHGSRIVVAPAASDGTREHSA